MLEIGAVQFFRDPLVTGAVDIQQLSKTHEIVSRSKTELWHGILTHYLPLYFPEAERFHRSSRTDWFLAFLEKYPSPHVISVSTKPAAGHGYGFGPRCSLSQRVPRALLLSTSIRIGYSRHDLVHVEVKAFLSRRKSLEGFRKFQHFADRR